MKTKSTETTNEITQSVILIDADRREIRKGEIKFELDADGKIESSTHEIDFSNNMEGFTIQESQKVAHCLNGEFVDTLNGFILYHNGEKRQVLGNGYVESFDVLPNRDYNADRNPPVSFPIENIVEGTGPIPGKLVVQWINPKQNSPFSGRNSALQEELDEKRALRDMAMQGMTSLLEGSALTDKGQDFVLNTLWEMQRLNEAIDVMADTGVNPDEK